MFAKTVHGLVLFSISLRAFFLLTVNYFRFLICSSETSDETYMALESVEAVMKVEENESTKNRSGRKINEYEAIWLGSKEGASCVQTPETISVAIGNGGINTDTKDSVFIQKSDEIHQLLNELRNTSLDTSKQQPSSPAVVPAPTFDFLSHAEKPVSPRLHPDRVLSELQELVERANRNSEEVTKSEAILLSVPVASSSLQRASPPSPSMQRSHLRLNSSLPVSRSDLPSPASPSSNQFFIPAPTTMSNTPSPGLISPVPIKMIPSAPSSPIALSFQATVGPYRSSTSSTDSTNQLTNSSVVPRISPKAEQNPSHKPTKNESKTVKAPAFRPPPPYPSKFYVKMPSVSKELASTCSTNAVSHVKLSPPLQRRVPPEYKAPPPVKPATNTKTNQPVAPPRSKRQVTSASQLPAMAAFPAGPPIPTRSFSSSSVPGIDVDAVAAVMAAAETSSSRSNSTGGSSSPTTAANKALSKALGKFHATAASFKTKFSQLSDGKDAAVEPSVASASPFKLERESSFVKTASQGGKKRN